MMHKIKFLSKTSDHILWGINRLDRFQKFLICLVCFTFVGTVFYGLVFSRRISLLEQKKKNFVLQKQLLSVYEAKSAALPTLLQQIQIREKQFFLAEQAIPDKKQLAQILDAVSRAAENAGAALLSFQEDAEEPIDFYKKIFWTMQARGNYRELVDFFIGIARMDRIVTIEKMSMKTDEKNSLILMHCTGAAYQDL